MSTFAEVAIAIFAFLAEITFHLARLAVAPLRFLFSSKYRLAARKQWLGHPYRCAAQLIGGTLALLFLAGMLSWWLYLLTDSEPAPAEIKHRILETIRAISDRRQ